MAPLQLCWWHVQLSVDDISLNADVYGDSSEQIGNYDHLKVCFYAA